MPKSATTEATRPTAGNGTRRVHLDQATTRDIQPPKEGSELWLDDEIAGFCLQVSYGGTKTFRVRYRKQIAGSPRPKWFSVAIGEFQDDRRAKPMPGKADKRRLGVTALVARERAVELRNAIKAGENPALEQRARRADVEIKAAQGVTVAQAYQRYLASIQSRRDPMRASSVVKVESSFDLHVLPLWGDRTMASLAQSDVSDLAKSASRVRKRKGRKVGGGSAANHVIAHVSAFLTWCTKQEPPLIATNVARLIDRREVLQKDHARERYLSQDEWAALMTELDDRPYRATRGSRFAETKTVRLDKPTLRALVSCEAIRISLLTGARKGEIYRMRWQDIDLAARWWIKPKETTKGGRRHEIALPSDAVDALRRLREAHADPIWVFPGKDRLDRLARGEKPKATEGTHVKDVHELWGKIRDELGMPDVHQHDLRHTAASYLISKGASLYDVGAVLGHRQAQTTMRYAHLLKDRKHELAAMMDSIAGESRTGREPKAG